MLVLSRRDDEAIILCDRYSDDKKVIIRVVQCHDGRCRLGVTAGPEVEIYREELWDRIKRKEQK